MTSPRRIEVLVVDDEEAVRSFFYRYLNFKGAGSEVVGDGFKAIEAVKKRKFDLAFLDIRMPGMNGLEVYGELKKIDPDLSCIFMTGYAVEVDLLDLTKQAGAVWLKKPFEDLRQIEEILNKVSQEAAGTAATEKIRQDRRAYARLDLALEVKYKLKQSQEPFRQSFAKNLGPGGVKVTIPENLVDGAIMELVINAPGHDEAFKACARKVWSKASPDKPGYYEIGARFMEMDVAAFTAFLTRCGVFKH